MQKEETLDYVIDVADTDLGHRWYLALQEILQRNQYLEKNFCFLGFPDTPRDLEYICEELSWAKNEINNFFKGRYTIEENYTPGDLCPDGLEANQDLMNKLHNHFEILQGTVWELSDWYKEADYTTKFAIRQLNLLCHEAESLMLSKKKKATLPEWIRPSQITTFLNCTRYEFPEELKTTFNETSYDRVLGGVYLHWTQIGKTLFEVFRDEKGVDIDKATCDAITHLRYYSGEFDVEWGKDVVYGGAQPWHTKIIDDYREWLERNRFDTNDDQYNFGYHRVGQVDLLASFGTTNPFEIWELLSRHLDIHKISAGDACAVYQYNFNDPDYYQQQIDRLKPGYDYSSSGR